MAETEKYLKEFLISEYENISNAHFNISQRIAHFFQYTLAIYTAPLFLLSQKFAESMLKENAGYIFSLVGFIGILMMMYIISLRFESLLYARNVNGLRRKIYEDNKFERYEDFSILPVTKKKPSYYDIDFIWVVLTYSIINTAYIFGGLLLAGCIDIMLIDFFFAVLLFLAHIGCYRIASFRRENNLGVYKRAIGVDIDGVLNKHRESFCRVYNIEWRKPAKLKPDELTEYPVHYTNLGITAENESKIFKYIEYWKNMEAREGAFLI